MADEIIPANSIHATPQPETAYKIEEEIKHLKSHISDTFFEMGRLLKAVRDHEYFKFLGFETIGQWFTSPDISLSPGWSWNVIKMYETYILELGMKPEQLEGIDYTKLYSILPMVKKHPEQATEWIEKANNLRRIDLQSEIKTQKISDRVQKIEKLQGLKPNSGVIHGDPIAEVKKLGDASIDIVITAPNPDVKPFVLQELFSEFRRVVKPAGSIFLFATQHNLGNIIQAMTMNDYRLVRDIVLAYTTAKKNTGLTTLLPYHELVLWVSRSDSPMYNLTDVERDVWPMTLSEDIEHPMEKPVDILLSLIKMASDEGQTLLDPFAGSGNIIVAAMTLKRGFVAIEEDELWYKKILEKVQSI